MPSPDKLLVVALRASGGMMMLAVVAALMPRGWIAGTHVWLGLGPLPEGPIVEYLARSLSAFYAFFGVLLWLLSNDPTRFAPILRPAIWVGVPFGVFVFWVDNTVGLPSYWRYGEGPMVVFLTLVLVRIMRRAKL